MAICDVSWPVVLWLFKMTDCGDLFISRNFRDSSNQYMLTGRLCMC